MALFTFPNRKGCSPISLTTQCPVNVIFKPIAKPAVLDIGWVPVDILIQSNQTIF